MTLLSAARIRSLVAAALGAGAFLALGLPLPLLLGPMLGCLVFALGRASLQGMGLFGTFMRSFLGIAIGSAITPAMVAELPLYGPSLVLIPGFVLVIGLAGYPLFRRIYRHDHATAFYAAMPGGLQDMLIFGEEAGGNVRAMSLIHATRVLVIVIVAPFVLTLLYGLDLTAPPGAPAATLPPGQIALMLAAALGGWQVARRLGMFGASILGPMIAAAALSLSGILTHRPPAEFIWLAQFFIGLDVGAKYTGITGRELRRDVGAGLLFCVVLTVISLVFIWLVQQLSSAGEIEVILAFLPGGQAEMVIVALVAGADVALVVAHHLLRILVVILLAPVFARWLGR
ncbi:MAG: AbrB family transcriptional regulator [Rhodobacteraceae bacterium]|nr:AbrB family transcriptional regulator [Paracoccaceae bacterium]